MFVRNLRFVVLPVALLMAAAPVIHAEEGMWTFDNPPLKQLAAKYNFHPTQAWLDHLRLASVRLNDGGSGSFVSPNGLLLTNHHVARGQLQKNSTAEHDYLRDGFYAATPDAEMKSADLEVNVLVGMEDVTARVQSAAKGIGDQAKALKARDAAIAAIEKESKDKTGLRSDVVSFYQGGEYWLYTYKAYTDVRLVFAPEQQAAFFGGEGLRRGDAALEVLGHRRSAHVALHQQLRHRVVALRAAGMAADEDQLARRSAFRAPLEKVGGAQRLAVLVDAEESHIQVVARIGEVVRIAAVEGRLLLRGLSSGRRAVPRGRQWHCAP